MKERAEKEGGKGKILRIDLGVQQLQRPMAWAKISDLAYNISNPILLSLARMSPAKEVMKQLLSALDCG